MGKPRQRPPVRLLSDSGIGLRASGALSWEDRDGRRWSVELDWADVDGRAECVGLTLRSFERDEHGRAVATDRDGAHPVTATVLRAFPIAFIDDARRRLASHYAHPPDGEKPTLNPASGAITYKELEHVAQWRQDDYMHKLLANDKRGRRLVDASGELVPAREALAEVARIYAAAAWQDKSPTAAVAKALNISHSAAAKRVARARAAGLLPRTTRGRASGGPIPTGGD